MTSTTHLVSSKFSLGGVIAFCFETAFLAASTFVFINLVTDMGLELRHTELGEDANMDQLLKAAEAMLLLQQGAGPCFNTYR